MKDYYFYFTKTDGLIRILRLGHKKWRAVRYIKSAPDDWYVGKVFRILGNPKGFGRSEITFRKRNTYCARGEELGKM